MAGRIPRNFIDDIIARTDIVDFIDSRVKLKKQGKDYRASCPFHNGNNNSSFSVSADKQFYHCFNCGASGNILSFIMEYDGIEFVDARRTIWHTCGRGPRQSIGTLHFYPIESCDPNDFLFPRQWYFGLPPRRWTSH